MRLCCFTFTIRASTSPLFQNPPSHSSREQNNLFRQCPLIIIKRVLFKFRTRVAPVWQANGSKRFIKLWSLFSGREGYSSDVLVRVCRPVLFYIRYTPIPSSTLVDLLSPPSCVSFEQWFRHAAFLAKTNHAVGWLHHRTREDPLLQRTNAF